MDQDTDLLDGESEGAGSVSPIEILVSMVRAAKRHRRLALSIAAGIAATGIAVALSLPSKFEAESRILAVQSAAVTAALSNPNRQVPNIEPFAGSTEVLMKKSNLRLLIEQADVAARWSSTRTWPLRLKDKATAILGGERTKDQMLRSLAEVLEKQMYVFHDGTTMTIHVTWQDPDSAWKIAQFAQSRFLELRHQQDLAVINAAISVNEDEVKRTADAIGKSLQELIKTKEQVQAAAAGSKSAKVAADSEPDTTKGGAKTQLVRRAPTASSASSTAPELEKKLAAQLAEIRQQVREVEAPWQRRIAELKFQLSDMRTTYGPEHPQVLQQEAKIQTAEIPPPELAALRQRERQLLGELERSAAAAADAPAQTAAARPHVEGVQEAPPVRVSARSNLQSADGTLVIAEKEDDPAVAAAKSNLQSALQRYSGAVQRLDVARVELASSEVAFKYKYSVVAEPERPNKATKPNRPSIMLGAIAAGILIGFLAGTLRELLSGKIHEPWQVKIMGVRVIGEVDYAPALEQKTT